MDDWRLIVEQWKKFARKDLVEQLDQLDSRSIKESFSTEIVFGTAGIRGKMGPGPNRINIYTIANAAYGFGKWLLAKGSKPIVVIGTDSRNGNHEFAEITAKVLSSLGITSLVKVVCPTPYVSFAIRHLKAGGGVVITASHNPPEYNGFKVYDDTGCQLLPSETLLVQKYSLIASDLLNFKYESNSSIIKNLPDLTDEYAKAVIELAEGPKSKNLRVSYTPLNGAGGELMVKVLKILGCKVFQVESQFAPDGNFAAVTSPNPEVIEAYDKAIENAIENNCDIILANDPDADRLGVLARGHDGNFQFLNGNQVGAIILDHLINKATNNLKRHFVVGTNVSAKIVETICRKNNITYFEVPTGFKWIAAMIEKQKNRKFLFGFEESLGYLLSGKIDRDKDSFQAATIISEIASEAKLHGSSLFDKLEEIYLEYGYFYDKTISFPIEKNSSTNEAKLIELIKNYHADNLRNTHYYGQEEIPQNLFRLDFDKNITIFVRPSGTEPKIKIYAMCNAKTKTDLEEIKIEMERQIEALLGEIKWKY